MNLNPDAILLVTLLGLAPAAAVAESQPWPIGTKEAAIAGCRASIVDHAEQDFLKRNNLKELPAGFREKNAPVIEPFLNVCNCVIDQVAKEWSFEYFSSHESEFPAKVNQLMARECASAIKQPSPQKPDERFRK